MFQRLIFATATVLLILVLFGAIVGLLNGTIVAVQWLTGFPTIIAVVIAIILLERISSYLGSSRSG